LKSSPLPEYWEKISALLDKKNAEMRFTDPNCGCTEVDECVELDEPCPPHSTCKNTIGSFDCTCESGYLPKLTESGKLTCIDENECANGFAKCDENAICENTSQGYQIHHCFGA